MAIAYSTPAMAAFDANYSQTQLVCAIANDTHIRDYPTFKSIAKLNRGECMNVIPDPAKGAPAKVVYYRGQAYYLVAGISGNLRVVSVRYTELR